MFERYCHLALYFPVLIINTHKLIDYVSVRSLVFKTKSLDKYSEFIKPTSDEITYDKLGRAHLQTPHSGSIHLRLRSTEYHGSSIATHVNDLYNIISKNQKPALMILADGGPDYTPAGVVNILFYYRLFKELNLDFLSVSTYAARYSAFNSIEHFWSPLSDMLAGVVVSPKLNAGTKPPCQQSQLSPDELREKEYAVFDNAISELSTFWKEAKFDGFPIQIKKIISGNDNLKWNDSENVKRFFKALVRDLSKYKELMVECNKMFRHLDRHLNEIVFVKCKDKTCCKEWLSKDLYNHLNQFKFRLSAPTKNKYHDGHYETFLQRCLNKEGKYGDGGQPTATKADLGKCDKRQNYSFKSKTGKDRHNAMFHCRQKKSISRS